MSAPREEVLAKVRAWVSYGDEDLRLAEHALTIAEPCPYRLVGYHAQQCAEKYLKAYLVHRGTDFPYTHNLSVLLELCEEHSPWPEEMAELETLTRFAITARYPGEDRPAGRGEALGAIELARRCRKSVRDQFETEGVALA